MKKNIDRIIRLFWYITALIIRYFIPVKPNRIFCCSYGLKNYSCSPRAFTEYLLDREDNQFEIYWAFNEKFDISNIDKRIKVVKLNTMSYLIALYSSKFIINNVRSNRYFMYFVKKYNQNYIMTWHGPFALKKIEKDAESQLGKVYIRRAIDDSKMCDLMLSNSSMFTKLIRSSFWYNGEILEKGIPRNDVFYDSEKIKSTYDKIRRCLGISLTSKIVLYAPTFRNDSSLDYYKLDWNRIRACFEKRFGGDVEVLVRFHPNMMDCDGINSIVNFPHVHNVTNAPDITEYLLASDFIISDYSSSMFDFMMLNRPCFIYAIDKDTYNRGFYVKINDLPMSKATSQIELENQINDFDLDKYQQKVESFINTVWGVNESGHACSSLYDWMTANV